jgi:acetoin utilization protein AcuB
MRIVDVMTPCPQIIPAETMLQEALKIMSLRSIRHLPVVHKSGDLIGVLCERDARLAHLVCESTGYCPSAGQVCQKDPIVVKENEEVSTIANEMYRSKKDCALVVDGKGHFIGIFTTVDACRTLHLLLSDHGEAIKEGMRDAQ